VNQGPQPGECGGRLLRQNQARFQKAGGLAGTPPVLRHAIDQNTVEIEDQQGSGQHGINKN
jgi:hypothetical protein